MSPRKRTQPRDFDGAATERGTSLIDWHEPDRNAHVLDWRARAHEFGLVPLDEHDQPVMPLHQPPEQILEEEEDEAFERQDIRAGADDDLEPSEADLEATAEETTTSEDVDLVRVYLRHIGRRKLLKAAEEQAIGRRMEVARADLLRTLGELPCARETLLDLAEQVRAGTAPAAELILLPDGGELTAKNVKRVLQTFTEIADLQKQIEKWCAATRDRRSTPVSRDRLRSRIVQASERAGELVA
jgi:hypothetical protein